MNLQIRIFHFYDGFKVLVSKKYRQLTNSSKILYEIIEFEQSC